jgi:hypothetical protein
LVLIGACSQDPQLTAPRPGEGTIGDKNGTETLGVPDIAISHGSGFAEGGVGMEGVDSGVLTVDVPANAAIRQVLLYWAGGTTGAPGDNEIMLDGTAVHGSLIGGPVFFYQVDGSNYSFSAFRADITELGLVQSGLNTLALSGFDFDITGSWVDENNGCSVVVITDDGTASELTLRDGLDMAYFGFEPTLDATVPQVFPVTPAAVDRTADLLLMVASVGEERPNRIVVTTSVGDQVIDDALGSNDGMSWDSIALPVLIPAGDESVFVQVVSTATTNPQGASLGWVGAGLAVALPVPATEEISGTVFVDADGNGLQGAFESGIGNVVVDITNSAGGVSTVVSAATGEFVFTGPAGTYTVAINLTDHFDAFNDDLAASFNATTPLSVTVGGAAANVDFGFAPDTEAILADLDAGTLVSDGKTLAYWTKVFRRAIIEQNSNRQARGHNSDSSGGSGWGHGEEYFDGEALLVLLGQVTALYQPDPYVFRADSEIEDAFAILKSKPRSDEARLFQELLVTELNYVAGRGLVSESDRLGVLISWGESLLVDVGTAKSADKAGSIDVGNAIRIFDAVNTGGGGGVDE